MTMLKELRALRASVVNPLLLRFLRQTIILLAMKLRGCGTALVTPFQQDGSLDEPALRELVRWQVESGIDFLVPCGTTGETPTLTHEEWLRVIDLTIETAGGRVPIMAGATSNNTREAVAKAKEASSRSGVDYILTATPYYNKPTQEGVYQHFKAIAEASTKPLVLYNIAGRTGTNIETPTLLRLAEIPNIIGVKEASGNIAQIAEVCATVPEDFLVFSGDDAITLAVIGLGGVGIISVASNEIPAEMSRMTGAALSGKWDVARLLFRKYLPLMQANFIESNPGPAKAVLAMMGRMEENYRLPLVPMKKENRAKLEKVAMEVGLVAEQSRDEVERVHYGGTESDLVDSWWQIALAAECQSRKSRVNQFFEGVIQSGGAACAPESKDPTASCLRLRLRGSLIRCSDYTIVNLFVLPSHSCCFEAPFHAIATSLCGDEMNISDRSRHFPDAVCHEAGLPIRHNFTKCSAAKRNNRCAASHGLHRHQRTGFLGRAGQQQRAGVTQQIELLLAKRRIDKAHVRTLGQVRSNLATEVIPVIAKRIYLSGDDQRQTGFFSGGDGQVRSFLFADTAEPEQVVELRSCQREVLNRDAVFHNPEEVRQVREVRRLRL